MNLQQLRIILCKPEESKNIGSVCRAMKNMNISHLRIIGNKNDYDEQQIHTLSIHAFDVWQQAEFYSTLQEAIADCSIAAGTTRRRGKKRKEWLMKPEEFSEQCLTRSTGLVGLVFGNERTGLTEEELDFCNLGICIPSSAEFGSLNLSHAVQIICYCFFKTTQPQSPGYTPITNSQINLTVESIVDNLEKIGFFKIAGKKEMSLFWKSLLARAALSKGEAEYLAKLFSKAAGLIQRKNNEE